MKIMILANNDAGLYKFRGELLEELLKEHEVVICLPDGEFVQNMKEMGCKYVPCDILDRHGTNPFKELELISFYKKVLREHIPDIVFTYTIKPNVYGGMVCAKLNVPYVVNITGLGTAVENGGLLQKITLILYKIGLRKAKKVFFQNTENREFMLSKKIMTCDHDLLPGSGVNLKQYQAFDYPHEKTVDFAFIGRIMKEKGIEQYLETAQYIRNKYPETRFHIVGDYEQDYSAEIEKLQNEGAIIYHGSVSNMSEVYKKVSCVIHPTYYPEGLSNVLLESSACARPIITTDRAGCREVIDDNINGFVCRQKDSVDLIKQVEKFMALSWEERRNLGLAGRKKVEKEFDRKIVINKYMSELK